MVSTRFFRTRRSAAQETGELRQRQLIHIPLELDHTVERHPVVIPAPCIELRVIRGAQADIAIAPDHPEQEPDLFLATVMPAYFTLDELFRHLITQPVARATDHLDVLGKQPGFFV